eukprot:scaffold112733_cov19-Prasinocladus_malaysianus.AAC.1
MHLIAACRCTPFVPTTTRRAKSNQHTLSLPLRVMRWCFVDRAENSHTDMCDVVTCFKCRAVNDI